MTLRTLLILLASGFSLLAGYGQEKRAKIVFTLTETGGHQPLPSRVHFRNAAGKSLQPGNLPFWRDHFVSPGTFEMQLEPGSYSYEIERGPEYFPIRETLAISNDTPRSITHTLHRVTDLASEGWWSGDLHVHRPLSDIELLLRAEDLHVAPVITWWNAQNLWSGKALPRELVTRFDNNRFYHVMGGEDERGGGALLFFNLSQPLAITTAKREHPSPMQFLTEARRNPAVWVDIEKPFWYDAPVWLASGMADSIGFANNHMYRSGVYPGEAWGRPRDKHRLPEPKGNGYWTQEIYYHALNCGLRIPPSAGSASGVLPNPVGYNRVYVHLDSPLTYSNWWEGLRAGRVFVSNGPLLRCRAAGRFPGHIFTAAKGQEITLKLEASLDSADPVSVIEIIKNGQVERSIAVGSGHQNGSIGEIRFNESGWFLVRAMADVPHTFRFASTGPFYVEVGDSPRRISKASAQFFVDWVRERSSQIQLDDQVQRAEVLQYHQQAEAFWKEKVSKATAE